LMSLGAKLDGGSIVRGGWTQLVGVAYERRIYAFRFETTPDQDNALIAKLDASKNRSHFEMLYNNCADFARLVLNTYFPRKFRRSIFPDADITTPKQVAYKLVRYSRKHPGLHLTVMEIPMVPGYQHLRRANNDVAEGLITTGYAVPLAIINPWIAGGVLADYLVEGRFHTLPKHPLVLAPDDLDALTARACEPQNPISAETQAAGATGSDKASSQTLATTNSGLRESKATNE
jgi:hypothetical protein